MTTPRQRAEEIIRCEDAHQYIKNWFGASSFFNTKKVSPLYRRDYFITEDHFMTSVIYAARHITPTGINTIAGPCDTYEEARQAIEEHIA